MTTNRRLQFLSGRNIYSPINDFWMLGNLTAMDPEIPNLPLEFNEPAAPQNPYRSRISNDVVVASWNVAPLPVVNRNRQIVDNTPAVDNPPVRSRLPLNLIPSLWQSEVRLQSQRKLPPVAVTDQPKASSVNTIVASWFFTFTMPPRSPRHVLSSPPIPKSNLKFEIIARAWAPFVLPQVGIKKAATLNDAPQANDRAYQVNLVPTLWTVAYFDLTTKKSIAVFTPNIPPVVIPGTPAGGYMPYTETATLGWGAICAYPQVVFDVAYEQAPRGVLAPVENPVIAAMPVSDKEKLARFAAAAAAFDLDLVRRYLEAVGIDIDG